MDLAVRLQALKENVMITVKANNLTWQEALSSYVGYLANINKDSDITPKGVQKLKHSTELAKARSEAATTEADRQFLSELESELAY
jgi:hypothetical protein